MSVTTTGKKRLPKDLREVLAAYVRLSPNSYIAFYNMMGHIDADNLAWHLDRRGYAVPRSIAAMCKPIEESEREYVEAQRASKQEHLDWLRAERMAKRMRREQRTLRDAAPQGNA